MSTDAQRSTRFLSVVLCSITCGLVPHIKESATRRFLSTEFLACCPRGGGQLRLRKWTVVCDIRLAAPPGKMVALADCERGMESLACCVLKVLLTIITICENYDQPDLRSVTGYQLCPPSGCQLIKIPQEANLCRSCWWYPDK